MNIRSLIKPEKNIWVTRAQERVRFHLPRRSSGLVIRTVNSWSLIPRKAGHSTWLRLQHLSTSYMVGHLGEKVEENEDKIIEWGSRAKSVIPRFKAEYMLLIWYNTKKSRKTRKFTWWLRTSPYWSLTIISEAVGQVAAAQKNWSPRWQPAEKVMMTWHEGVTVESASILTPGPAC